MARRSIGLRPLRAPRERPRSLNDFDICDQLCFLAAWFPQRPQDPPKPARWQSWAAYLDDYEAIRDELRAHFSDRARPIFAERVRSFVAANGREALQRIGCFEYLIAALDQFDGGANSAA